MTSIPKCAKMIEDKATPSAQTSSIRKESRRNVDVLEAPQAPERNKDPGKPD